MDQQLFQICLYTVLLLLVCIAIRVPVYRVRREARMAAERSRKLTGKAEMYALNNSIRLQGRVNVPRKTFNKHAFESYVEAIQNESYFKCTGLYELLTAAPITA